MTVFEPVKVLSCKSCGSSVNQYNPESLTVICSHCGTHTVNSEQVYANEIENPLFKLHETFEYKSTTWQTIGCIRYEGSVREWDDEDDVWEHTPWSYNSWWVMNEMREIVWITQDVTGYKWSNKTTLKTNSIPENDMTYEKGSWEIKATAGEFSYFPRVGGLSETYEKNQSSIEISLDENFQRKEIESFISTPLDSIELLKIFNKTDILKGIERAKLVKKAIIASIVCLVIGYFLLTMRSETLFTISPKSIQSTIGDQVIPIGEVNLEKESLLQFKFWSSSLPRTDGSFDAELIIKDDNDVIVSEVPIGFWRESGVDSDGSWTESSKSVSPRLKLPKNNYHLSLKPNSFITWKNIQITGQIKKNLVSGFPLVIGGLLLVLLFIIQSLSSRKFIRKSIGIEK